MPLTLQQVLNSEELPSIPEVAQRALQLAKQKHADIERLADAVRADPAMASKILRTANSAYFGRQYKVSSIQAAIPVLGATLIRTLVLGFSLTERRSWQRLEGVYRTVWRRALWQAVTAEALARRTDGADAETYFLAGLLQDVGVLAMLRTSPEEYVERAFSSSTSVTLADAERQAFGFTHVDVSCALCERWSLSQEILAAIKSHHDPLDVLRDQVQASSSLAQALKLSSRCAHHLEQNAARFPHDVELALGRGFGLRGPALHQLCSDIEGRMAEVAHAMDADLGDALLPEELLSRARSVMQEIAIDSQLDAAAARKDARRYRDRLTSIEDRSRALEQEMVRDPLTGAFNRRVLASGLEAEIAMCSEREKPLGMLFLDVDDFKQFNDLCGHPAGDAALRTVVDVLRRSLRQDDLIVRYGGDEFIAILWGVAEDCLHSIANRVCHEVEMQLGGKSDLQTPTASIGALFCPSDILATRSLSSLVADVDRSMYAAKAGGGNRVHLLSLAASAGA